MPLILARSGKKGQAGPARRLASTYDHNRLIIHSPFDGPAAILSIPNQGMRRTLNPVKICESLCHAGSSGSPFVHFPKHGRCTIYPYVVNRSFCKAEHRWRGHHRLSLQSRGNQTLAGFREPTIYALSTAPGRAAIAIIRLSGPACLNVYHALCPNKPAPKPRHATLRTLYQPHQSEEQQDILDANALILYFPAPQTVTGEDVLEFHIHGGPAIVKAVLAAIPNCICIDKSDFSTQSARYAEPGEFTRRAFYNERLDLAQVEALGDTLAAETEQQRRLAIRGSTSQATEWYEDWRQSLQGIQGEMEALIDFSEDQDLGGEDSFLGIIAAQVRELKGQMTAIIDGAARGELLRHGINIALVGAPNAGKSSLLNRIVKREAAIVSEQAGTTRDVVDVSVDIEGYLCRFGDLAGLRRKHEDKGNDLNRIEEEGIRRARQRALQADVVIVFLSVREAPIVSNVGVQKPLTADDVYLGAEVEATLEQLDRESQKVVCVLNKADLFADTATVEEACLRFGQHPALQDFLIKSKTPIIPLSCKAMDMPSMKNVDPEFSVEQLLESLTELFGAMTEAVSLLDPLSVGSWAESLGASARQSTLLKQCVQQLDDFLTQIDDTLEGNDNDTSLTPEDHKENQIEQQGNIKVPQKELDVVLATESLREAAACLAKITGKGDAGDVEEILGVVFEKFCVGK